MLRNWIEAVVAFAALVLVFDNGSSKAAGVEVLGSVAVLLVCFISWRKLNLGDASGSL
jgi:hypothetical protein